MIKGKIDMLLNRRYEKQINGYINMERILGHYLYTYNLENDFEGLRPINCFESPLLAHISLTDKCNLHCPYCYAQDGSYTKDMGLDEYKTIIDKLGQQQVLSVILTGGEPLMHPQINEILEYTIQKKISILLLSNLLLLDRINTAFLSSPYLAFQISLNGIWDDNRNNNFDLLKTVQNYKRLKELRVPVIATIVIDNIEIDLDELFSFMEKHNVTTARFGLLIKLGRSKTIEGDKKYAEYVKKVTQEILKYRNSHQQVYFTVQTEYCEFSEKHVTRRTTLCEAGVSELFVDRNGDVYPCPLFKSFKKFWCGNLLSDSMENIWNSEVMNGLRCISLKEMGCDSCNNKCGVWCRGLVYSYTGKLDVKSPFCIKENV